jgi:hypothetical protein
MTIKVHLLNGEIEEYPNANITWEWDDETGDLGSDSGWRIHAIDKNCTTVSAAINKKIQGLDLLEYIGFMATARQVCQGYDRYITELQATIAMHDDLKRYYQMKEQKLVAEYKEKEAALTTKYAALLEGAEKKDG